MQIFLNETFEGERVLYKLADAKLSGVTVNPGESPLKHGRNLSLTDCTIDGKYPLWITEHVTADKCLFKVGSRSGPWYVKDFTLKNSQVDAPKQFRDSDGIVIRNCRYSLAQETLWSCRNVDIEDTVFDNGDYLLIHSEDVRLKNVTLNGNYLLQWGRNAQIFDCTLHSKDAFWNSENITCYNCLLDGEYLGWHSRNLHLVNCTVKGTQPLCYCENLVLENCTFDADADLAFEYSSVRAEIKGAVTSVKNPTTGSIEAGSIGRIILDENVLAPANCRITTKG